MSKEVKLGIAGGLLALVLICGISSCSTVPANNVGIKYNKFSGTSETTLSEGVYMKIPFVEKIIKIDTTVQERTDENVYIQTADSQFLTLNVNIKYKVDSENAFKVFKRYGSLDSLTTNVIGNYAQEALNEVFSQYNVIDLLGTKRNEAIAAAKNVLADKYAGEGVSLEALTIKDMDAGDEIEKAIQDEAVAKKKVETANQELEISKAEAEKRIVEAEAEAKETVIQAEAEAEANKIISESITDELIKSKEADARLKWGWVTVNGAGSVIVED